MSSKKDSIMMSIDEVSLPITSIKVTSGHIVNYKLYPLIFEVGSGKSNLNYVKKTLEFVYKYTKLTPLSYNRVALNWAFVHGDLDIIKFLFSFQQVRAAIPEFNKTNLSSMFLNHICYRNKLQGYIKDDAAIIKHYVSLGGKFNNMEPMFVKSLSHYIIQKRKIELAKYLSTLPGFKETIKALNKYNKLPAEVKKAQVIDSVVPFEYNRRNKRSKY